MGLQSFLLFSNFCGQKFLFSIIWATFSVYIAILKEIEVNLAIFTPKKVFSPSRPQIRPFKKTRLYPPGKNLELYPPPVDSDLAHHCSKLNRVTFLSNVYPFLLNELQSCERTLPIEIQLKLLNSDLETLLTLL